MDLGIWANLPEKMQERYGSLEGQVLKTCPKCGDAIIVVKMVTPDSVLELKEQQIERDIHAIMESRKYQESPELFQCEIDALRLGFVEWKKAYNGEFLPFCAPCSRPCACGLCG